MLRKIMMSAAVIGTCLFTSFTHFAWAEPSEQEQILGPWLDLTGGGHAVGPAQTIQPKNSDGSLGAPVYGRLQNGTLLPEKGQGFIRINSPTTSWGTGMMVSLLTRASLEMNQRLYPGITILIASIAQEHGGPYRPHKSHQNGLDADVVFAGQTKYETVLDKDGRVTEKFHPEKNWNFWKLFVQQQILQKGQPTTVVSMIFVSPEIKQYMCAWAKQRGLLSNPLDAEVMRRLRPTAGHDDHFHIRLKCSPHHPLCQQQGEIASGTGCPE